MKSFEQWIIENNFANTGQTMEEIASAIMLELNIVEITKAVLQSKVFANNLYYDPMLYRQYLESEERNEKELRSTRNAIEIIKKLFVENTELRKRLEN
jgi:hypoxanthine phosphoribosyltransferase